MGFSRCEVCLLVGFRGKYPHKEALDKILGFVQVEEQSRKLTEGGNVYRMT
jgi:hypothetical protein